MTDETRNAVQAKITEAKQTVFTEMARLAGTTVTDDTEKDIADLHMLIPMLNIVKSATDASIPEVGDMANQPQKNRLSQLQSRAQDSRARMLQRAGGKKVAAPVTADAPTPEPVAESAPPQPQDQAQPQPPQQ